MQAREVQAAKTAPVLQATLEPQPAYAQLLWVKAQRRVGAFLKLEREARQVPVGLQALVVQVAGAVQAARLPQRRQVLVGQRTALLRVQRQERRAVLLFPLPQAHWGQEQEQGAAERVLRQVEERGALRGSVWVFLGGSPAVLKNRQVRAEVLVEFLRVH